MKTVTKKAFAKRKIIREQDIIGPMMVYNGPLSQEDMEQMSEMAFERKAAREAAAQKKQTKNSKSKVLSKS